MEKRTFLKSSLLLGVAAASASFLNACKSVAKSAAGPVGPTLPSPKIRRSKPFELPA